MVRCIAENCESSSHRKTPGISFHRFPTDESQRRIWLDNMNLQVWKPKAISFLCSRHFEPRYLDISAFCTRLLPGAVPTIKIEELNKPKAEPDNFEDVDVSEPVNDETVPVAQNVQYILSSLPRREIPQNDETVPVAQNVQYILSSLPRREIPQILTEQPQINSDLVSEKNSDRIVSQLKNRIIKKNKKIRILQQQTRRLKNKVKTFSKIISDLKSRLSPQRKEKILVLSHDDNKESFVRYLRKE